MVLHDKGEKMKDFDDLTIEDLNYNECPVCDSTRIQGYEMEEIPDTGGCFIQEFTCHDCGATWQVSGYVHIKTFECIQDGEGNELIDLVE